MLYSMDLWYHIIEWVCFIFRDSSRSDYNLGKRTTIGMNQFARIYSQTIINNLDQKKINVIFCYILIDIKLYLTYSNKGFLITGQNKKMWYAFQTCKTTCSFNVKIELFHWRRQRIEALLMQQIINNSFDFITSISKLIYRKSN